MDVAVAVIGRETREIRINTRFQFGDSTTLVSTLLQGRELGLLSDQADVHYGFHLPFDQTMAVYTPTWDRWMANNLDVLMGDGSALDDVPMWFGTTPQAEFGYHDMTTGWINTLRTSGHDPIVYQYSGTLSHPATSNAYTYYLLREMLIFHSNNFNK